MCVCVRARKDESTEGGQRAELSLDTSLPPPPPPLKTQRQYCSQYGFPGGLANNFTKIRCFVVFSTVLISLSNFCVANKRNRFLCEQDYYFSV